MAIMAKQPKRPRDPMQRAKMIGDIATGEIENDPLPDAVAVKRGTARAAKLSPERKRAIARKAAKARWKKKR